MKRIWIGCGERFAYISGIYWLPRNSVFQYLPTNPPAVTLEIGMKVCWPEAQQWQEAESNHLNIWNLVRRVRYWNISLFSVKKAMHAEESLVAKPSEWQGAARTAVSLWKGKGNCLKQSLAGPCVCFTSDPKGHFLISPWQDVTR